jgi:biotin carboxylase
MEKYNKNLLILGAGIDQVPGIQKARDLGCYTIVLDGNPNSIGKEISDEFYTVNIKDYMEIETFLKNYNSKKIDGVIAYGVDIPTIIAKTADYLGVNYTIPTKSAIISEDKYESKVFMEQNNISVPKFKLVENIENIYIFAKENGFPIIIKPVDNSASRGIIFINNIIEIEKAYYYALEFSKNKKIIVESYLFGEQISSETLVIDGEIFHLGFLDRNYEKNEMFYPNIIEDGGDMPSTSMKDIHIMQLTNFYKVIAKKLDIKNGVIKGDLVIFDGELYIIEFALRLSGGNFSTICIPNSSHYDIIKYATMIHLNIPIDKNEFNNDIKNDFISMRYKFLEESNVKPNQKVKDIISKAKTDDIIYTNMHYSKGSIIPDKTTDHSKRLGFVIAKGNSREDAILNANSYLKNLEFIVE